MSKHSRRAVLAGIATAPALAEPALAWHAGLPRSAPSSSVRLDDSPAGALARFEMALGLLRGLHVCNGWSVDEAAAQQVLQYFQERAAAGTWKIDEDNEAEMAKEQASIAFLGEHGQSLDWIICGDIGAVVVVGARYSRRAKKVRLADEDFWLDPRYAGRQPKGGVS
jgi:hypothetical protein